MEFQSQQNSNRGLSLIKIMESTSWHCNMLKTITSSHFLNVLCIPQVKDILMMHLDLMIDESGV